MINPKILCRKHLLGEHSEIHKHRHNFVKQHKIYGRLYPVVQIEPLSMETRHNQLANEMIKRNYNHNSDYTLPDLSYLPEEYLKLKVDMNVSMKDLFDRCEECESRYVYDCMNF